MASVCSSWCWLSGGEGIRAEQEVKTGTFLTVSLQTLIFLICVSYFFCFLSLLTQQNRVVESLSTHVSPKLQISSLSSAGSFNLQWQKWAFGHLSSWADFTLILCRGWGRKDGTQCSVGAKGKAAVAQVASVLRTPVTFRCGLACCPRT